MAWPASADSILLQIVAYVKGTLHNEDNSKTHKLSHDPRLFGGAFCGYKYRNITVN